MNQVDRRQREQLLPQELALLRSCGNEIRRTDSEALDLARIRADRNITPTERLFKARWTLRALLKGIARRTWEMLKADAAHLRRRQGL